MHTVTQLNQSVQFETIQELIEFRNKIQLLIDAAAIRSQKQQQAAEAVTIGNAEALRVAAGRGVELVNSTLVSACESGGIIGARKPRGRWMYEREAFEAWLASYSPKKR